MVDKVNDRLLNSCITKGVIKVKKFLRFLKEEEGVTAIEYGLIAALIAVLIIAAVTSVGLKLKGTFEAVDSALP